MSTIDLFYLITGLIFAASAVTIFILKKLWVGLALFGLGWAVMVIKDFVVPSEAFDVLLHAAVAIVFFVQAGVTYRKTKR
ncbi:hypothetical protein ACU639_17775 [Streptomyces cynarae]|uniref:hypothetical protein n=1 Tax=Streptomyces cynarae TaxID=2981134 RepID=UPI00406C212D